MIRDQRGSSLISTMVAIGLLTILLLLVLNSTTDQFLVKNANLEIESDLDYSLNSVSKALIHTSSLSQDTSIKIGNYINVLSVEKPQTLYLKEFYSNGRINTDGLKLDVLNTRVTNNLRIDLTISEIKKLTGSATSELTDATYSFKSNASTAFHIEEGTLDSLHPVIRGSGGYVTGLNLSYATEIPKSVDQDNLRLKVPDGREGGNTIGGTYKAE